MSKTGIRGENGLEQFLKRFYETISFESGELFKADEFRNLFMANASLLETGDGGLISKTVEDHIKEFQYAIAEYPELFENGFHEHQTDVSIIENETCFLVSSKYRKRYTRYHQPVVEDGINNMVLVKGEHGIQIASVLW